MSTTKRPGPVKAAITLSLDGYVTVPTTTRAKGSASAASGSTTG
jgi:hypothetical protein